MNPRRLATLSSILLAATVIVIDWNTWIELNVSILYGIPLVLAAAARSRRLLWSLTAALVTVTLIVYAIQVPAHTISPTEPYLVDRIMSAAALLLTALLLHALIVTLDALNAEQQSLQSQNRELNLAYRQLSHYQDEITRQNQELERRRQEAEAASGRKSRMLVAASHDLRSPINAISLMAEVIRRTAENPALAAQIPGLATRLQTNALSLADLVADVLDIAAFDSGRASLHEGEFWLDAMLMEQCSRFLPLALAKNLRLELEPPEPAPCLRTDRTKLERILDNLVTNAIKYTDTGAITIRAGTAADGSVFIRVEDTGPGIAPDDLERVFDEFAQLGAGTEGTKGWGLGLAICKRLAEIIGSVIEVESRLQAGSAFTVKLPADVVVHRAAALERIPPMTAAERSVNVSR